MRAGDPGPEGMENRKYRPRLMSAGRPMDGEGKSLKEQYGEEKKEELIVPKSAAVKLSRAYSAVVQAVMAAFALIGGVSLARPELRAILAGIILEAIREIKGF
ncbi:hypothetical protein [Otoolea muris]|uniref:hypothetical protein n=1 Tax=Otoolea muris TaxID=2941515 RepID=UPI002041383A|nr:hypothetical protein [Otoolea muris]